jgi:plastocyanin
MKTEGRQAPGVPVAALAAIGGLIVAGVAIPTRAADLVPQRHVVEIRGMAFHPSVLQVRRGDTVVWINRDIVPHTATATRNTGWNTGPLLQKDSARYVARRSGTDTYVCELHPTMVGKLIVR